MQVALFLSGILKVTRHKICLNFVLLSSIYCFLNSCVFSCWYVLRLPIVCELRNLYAKVLQMYAICMDYDPQNLFIFHVFWILYLSNVGNIFSLIGKVELTKEIYNNIIHSFIYSTIY